MEQGFSIQGTPDGKSIFHGRVEYIRKDVVHEMIAERVSQVEKGDSIGFKELQELWGIGTRARVKRIVDLLILAKEISERPGKSWSFDREKVLEIRRNGTLDRIIGILKDEGRW